MESIVETDPLTRGNSTDPVHLFGVKYGPLSSDSSSSTSNHSKPAPAPEWLTTMPAVDGARIVDSLPRRDGSGTIVIGLFEGKIEFPSGGTSTRKFEGLPETMQECVLLSLHLTSQPTSRQRRSKSLCNSNQSSGRF